jgi:hypothetical protein
MKKITQYNVLSALTGASFVYALYDQLHTIISTEVMTKAIAPIADKTVILTQIDIRE